MTKFKAGDKAVLLSVELGWAVKVGAEVTIKKGPFEGSAGPGYYVELCDEPGSCLYYTEWRLGPLDDPLPPAPKSVRYYHNTLRGVDEDAYFDVHSGNFASGPRIRIKDKDNRGITIDADTALQLAHDLTRMAMEIKRKEKQRG